LKKSELIAFASSYVSFVLERMENIKEIILFGSVVRGDFDKSSDVDVFIDLGKENPKSEKELNLISEKFYKSIIYKNWKQKGINNKINAKIGDLNTWDLKRSIISDGIVLYGKYKGEIKGENYLLITFNVIKDVAKRNKVIRELFGREEEKYHKEGLVKQFGGKKLSPTTLLVKQQFSDKILELLRKEKVDFKMFEIWSDNV
jgi:predicted nucleotidyltransferase